MIKIKYNRCTICDDYDLCSECSSNGVTTKGHEVNHLMDQILAGGLSHGYSGIYTIHFH